ncbi:hypothetical protein LMG31506_00499 [Cupriavidus yeoncheonensis]|uniref:Uncharacterized protein n=1 Tax=Cupriavidus yeoncheonensis TaxID=1462994 RepID=A0A916N1N3_9BURK|nr:hypothetical protein [Cupriavidus yeoncheonensis]CAG2128568.1 hypothetical protein LMG31506_00499 [Cupriavidus yeoncheonensis]
MNLQHRKIVRLRVHLKLDSIASDLGALARQMAAKVLHLALDHHPIED